MFINKISMSQTCLHNSSCQKATGFLQQPCSLYRVLLVIVQHNTNFATVLSQVTVANCSAEYEYKLLHQFTTTVGGTRCCLWLEQSQSKSITAGPHKEVLTLCATAQANWHRSLYTYSTEQPSTVKWPILPFYVIFFWKPHEGFPTQHIYLHAAFEILQMTHLKSSRLVNGLHELCRSL